MFYVFLCVAVINFNFGGVESKSIENFKLIILHNNDMHARFDQINHLDFRCSLNETRDGLCLGGFARVNTV